MFFNLDKVWTMLSWSSARWDDLDDATHTSVDHADVVYCPNFLKQIASADWSELTQTVIALKEGYIVEHCSETTISFRLGCDLAFGPVRFIITIGKTPPRGVMRGKYGFCLPIWFSSEYLLTWSIQLIFVKSCSVLLTKLQASRAESVSWHRLMRTLVGWWMAFGTETLHRQTNVNVNTEQWHTKRSSRFFTGYSSTHHVLSSNIAREVA